MFQVFKVTSFGKPVGPPRPELHEKMPRHADMLRYDRAFHNPTDPSEIIFPRFKGWGAQKITYARWSSFVMNVEPAKAVVENAGDWITYVHPPGAFSDLAPKTLREFMQENNLKLTATQNVR